MPSRGCGRRDGSWRAQQLCDELREQRGAGRIVGVSRRPRTRRGCREPAFAGAGERPDDGVQMHVVGHAVDAGSHAPCVVAQTISGILAGCRDQLFEAGFDFRPTQGARQPATPGPRRAQVVEVGACGGAQEQLAEEWLVVRRRRGTASRPQHDARQFDGGAARSHQAD